MNITRIISTKPELRNEIISLLETRFNLAHHIAERNYDDSLSKNFDQLIDSIWILIETPYIDKVYRDSYYNYFSTKLARYERDCIRLSFFDREIRNVDFQDETQLEALQKRYLGFMVLRPTDPQVLGRSVISKNALKYNNFVCTSTEISATVNSVKFKINGFPHSSQDAEITSCAETTLWAIMEYFGNKYPEYKPVLPSQIINVLKQVSTERQIPSNGLNIQQIAFALKEFGFGTKVYSKEVYGETLFKRLFSTYIESGIPIISAVENRPVGNIGHVLISIGHDIIQDDQIDNLMPSAEIEPVIQSLLTAKNITLFDNDDIDKSFVLIDDNCPAYQLAHLNNPTIHYPDPAWHNCKITYFIVPLYPKIYLEAFKAKNFFLGILFNWFTNIPDYSNIFIRFFLCSSRSFKHELSLKRDFNQVIKDLILETQMPKFIWIGEISTKELIKNKLANGLVIIDATQANDQSVKVVISAAYEGVYIFYDAVSKWIKKSLLPLGTFSIFTNNLK